MVWLPEKKVLPLPSAAFRTRPIRAINIQTGVLLTRGERLLTLLREWRTALQMLTQRHTSAQPCCLHTQRETQTQRERAGVMAGPLQYMHSQYTYGPVPSKALSCLREKSCQPPLLDWCHMKLYWWQRKHYIVEAGNKLPTVPGREQRCSQLSQP